MFPDLAFDDFYEAQDAFDEAIYYSWGKLKLWIGIVTGYKSISLLFWELDW